MYASIPAEDIPEVSQRLGVSAVPTVVVTVTGSDGGKAAIAGRIDGAKPADITALVKKVVCYVAETRR